MLRKCSLRQFKVGCAYKHQTNQEAEMVKNLDQEVINLKREMIHLKSVIQQMQSEIALLHEAIDNITKTNIGEIVAIVAPALESKKDNHNFKMKWSFKLERESVYHYNVIFSQTAVTVIAVCRILINCATDAE